MNEFEMSVTNNYIIVSGVVENLPLYDHESFGQKFYTATLAVVRSSGTFDHLQMMIPESLMPYRIEDLEGMTVVAEGQIRSYEKLFTGKNRHLMVVYPEYLYINEGEIAHNYVSLEGTICKPTTYRLTPFGREITDMCIAINRAYGKSDYLHCITWGRTARFVSHMNVGDKVKLEGRFQSREYTKITDDGVKNRTAYEVSVSKLWKIV